MQKNSTFIIVVICGFLLGSLFWIAKPVSGNTAPPLPAIPTPASSSTLLSTYVDAKFGFAFLYPSNMIYTQWEPTLDILSSTSFYLSPIQNDTEQIPEIAVTVFSNPQQMDISEWAELHGNPDFISLPADLRTSAALFENVSDIQMLTVNGHKSLIFSQTSDGLTVGRALIDDGVRIISIAYTDFGDAELKNPFSVILTSFAHSLAQQPATPAIDTRLRENVMGILSKYESPSLQALSLKAPLTLETGYKLPWVKDVSHTVTQGWAGTTSHGCPGQQCYAYDFNLAEGEEVRAARGGTVSNVAGNFTACGGYDYRNSANRVTINHDDGSATLYLHLKQVDVSLNISVTQGARIGLAGKTGWTSDGTSCHAHLHFQRQDQGIWITNSRPIYFVEYYNQQLSVGSTYTSQNGAGLGAVSGIVRTISNQSVSGANVTFTSGGINWTTTTDSSGLYHFTNVPAGSATVKAVYNGTAGFAYPTVQQYAEVWADIWLNQCAGTNGASSIAGSCGLVPTPTPQPPPPSNGWNETFFSDNNLGSQCGTRNETDVYVFRDSDTGWSPPSGCPNSSSAWSVRMERTVYFQGGTYEFGLFYDDGARLFIDNNLDVDGWNATQHYESHYVPPGNRTIRLEYKNNAGHAIVQMWWRGPGALPANTQTQDPNQWWVNYWGNQTQWQDAVGSENEGTGILDRDWGNDGPGFGIPSDHFSLKFTRFVYFDCGTYSFHLISDDGSRLFLDGTSVPAFDHWSTNVWDTASNLFIQTGSHEVKVDYFENGGGARVYLDWTKIASCIPAAPSNLQQSTATQTSITLSWQDNSNNEDGFNLYKWEGSGFRYFASVGANTTSFTDQYLPCSFGVLYEVSAYSSSGESPTIWYGASTSNCPAVANDNLDNAKEIFVLPYSDNMNTAEATSDVDDPELANCNRDAGLASVWYIFTPDRNERVQFDTLRSDYDTMLAVWTGLRGSLNPIVCNDDVGDTTQSSVVVSAIAGTTYFIEVTEYNSGSNATESRALNKLVDSSSALSLGGNVRIHAKSLNIIYLPLVLTN